MPATDSGLHVTKSGTYERSVSDILESEASKETVRKLEELFGSADVEWGWEQNGAERTGNNSDADANVRP